LITGSPLAIVPHGNCGVQNADNGLSKMAVALAGFRFGNPSDEKWSINFYGTGKYIYKQQKFHANI